MMPKNCRITSSFLESWRSTTSICGDSDELLIYNNYEIRGQLKMESLIQLQGMIETLSFANGLASQYIKLRKYHRSFLESGEFWRRSKTRFDAQGRVDTTLMSNLRIMRRTLINQISKRCNESKEAISRVVHALLSRSIFVKYLEEGKIQMAKQYSQRAFIQILWSQQNNIQIF